MAKLKIEDFAKGFEVSEASPRTPVLAAMQIAIAQTFILELMKSEGAQGKAAKVAELLEQAQEILLGYDTTTEH
jgi:hypothetical protein